MNKILVAIAVLDLIILYQFAVWFENALKNQGWFDGLTIPIVSFGALVFILTNIFVVMESLKGVELIRKERV